MESSLWFILLFCFMLIVAPFTQLLQFTHMRQLLNSVQFENWSFVSK